jgi:Uri superfamily endonuclease
MRSQMRNSAGSKVLWHIDFLDETHHPSCRSVACVNGARLERSLEG